jgi:ElaB/YqjD/DUF883 family membrane-anchored ribosome-binding protein
MHDRSDPPEGTAEVRTHLGVRPSGESAGHDADDDPMQRVSGSTESVGDAVEEDDYRQRARHLLAGSRHRAQSAIRDAERRVDEKTGVIGLIREHPLPAVGLAFALGFVLAGRSDPETRLGQVRKKIRGAAATAVTAALVEEARHLVGSEGGLASLLELVVERIREPVEDWT